MNKKIIFSSVLVAPLFLLSSMGNDFEAATYKDSNNASSIGKVKFIEGESEIVDPKDPDKPVDPVEPVNPNKGDLMIQYVSDFDFGVHKKTVNGITANSKPDLVVDKKDDKKEKYDVVPFVSTLDTRTNRNGGWNLRVSATEFKGTNKSNNEVVLKGAEVIFSNVSYAQPKAETPVVNSEAASAVVKDGFKLQQSPQKIATSDESKVESQGMGSYSLALGSELVNQTDDNLDSTKSNYKVTNGVTFNLPKNTSVSVADYTADINWELVPGI
ncbi:WxL domain-containing protein [Vagococcus carniphilus]|uniref:WxL domain-containing protein n=1 Tax=Vagococcus carniphilus TaxID=218144 RepID=A0A430B014_9ENTE|nr:WxL domain-containing protein [Vagococcus carniphilus]QNN72944.1 WxL domain-containing protein [Vagococcus carniphilus]RSU13591.1 hypothetical protein CBF28_08875 [Vagococcus carniphilus]